MNRPRLSAGQAQETAYSVRSVKLPPEFDGFRIAHISDIHSRPASGVGEIISAARPDITVITGDLLHDDDAPIDEVIKLLRDILKVSPVYMITGNHDLWRAGHERDFCELKKMGVQILDDEHTEIERGGEKLFIYGVRDQFSKVPEIISSNLQKSFSALSDNTGYKILLFHRANLFDEIKDYGFDLILSGHMHGGQFAVPRLGGVLAPSSALLSGKRMFFPKYCSGVVETDRTTMIINRGLGNTLPLPRWGNPPEVGIVTLLHEEKI